MYPVPEGWLLQTNVNGSKWRQCNGSAGLHTLSSTNERLNVHYGSNIADIYKTFHPTFAKYTFFSSVLGTFSSTYHMLGHKASLSKLKKN